jgi:cell division protein FtsB
MQKAFSDKIGKCYSALVLFLIISIPFAHLAGGKRGLIAMFRLKSQIAQATVKLDMVRAERIAVENQVTLLSASSIDLDMLDEKARQILDFASPKEVIVLPRHLEE